MEASDAAPFRSRRIRTGLGFTTFSTSEFRTSVGLPAPGSSFGYMFGDLQKDPANRIPPTPATVLALKQLAKQ